MTNDDLNDDQSLENDILPIEETPAIEEIPSEEADSEPIEKKTRQLSILDYCKK